MKVDGQEVGMAVVLNAIKLDVLMGINYCSSGNTELGLQHLVSAQQTIDKLMPIAERTDAVMERLSTAIKG